MGCPRIEPGLAVCTARALPVVLSSWAINKLFSEFILIYGYCIDLKKKTITRRLSTLQCFLQFPPSALRDLESVKNIFLNFIFKYLNKFQIDKNHGKLRLFNK